jgi:PspA associated protein B
MTFFKRFIDSIGDSRKTNSDSDAIFTLSSSYISLESKLNLINTGRCGICIKKTDAEVSFNELKLSIENLLEASKKTDLKLSYGVSIDEFDDLLWLVIDVRSIEDSVACITVVSEILEQKGPMIMLESAVFEFGKKGSEHQPYYLIYDYELNKFYPFVPIISRQKARNSREEMNMMRAVSDDNLPIEEDESKWDPIWHLPF